MQFEKLSYERMSAAAAPPVCVITQHYLDGFLTDELWSPKDVNLLRLDLIILLSSNDTAALRVVST